MNPHPEPVVALGLEMLDEGSAPVIKLGGVRKEE